MEPSPTSKTSHENVHESLRWKMGMLETAVALSSKADAAMAKMHAASCPTDGAGGEVSLPSARGLAEVKVHLARQLVQQAAFEEDRDGKHLHDVFQDGNENTAGQPNVLSEWLKLTEPKKECKPSDRILPPTNRAIVVLNSALALLHVSSSSAPKSEALALLGRCWRMRLASTGSRLLGSLWRPSALDLALLRGAMATESSRKVEDAAGKDKGGKTGQKDKGGGGGGSGKKDVEAAKGMKDPIASPEPLLVPPGEDLEEMQDENVVVKENAEVSDGGGHIEGAPLYLKKGRAVLSKALAEARMLKQWGSLGEAAHELAVLVGWGESAVAPSSPDDKVDATTTMTTTPDVFRTVANLCVYHSCKMRQYLWKAIEKAASPTCRQMLLLKERERLLQLGPSTPTVIPKIRAIEQYLDKESCFWKRMDCSIPAESIVEDLPDNVKLLVLDLAPSMQFLYASLITKDPKQAAVARSPLSSEDRQRFHRLQRRLEAWKMSLGKALLSLGDDMGFSECLNIALATTSDVDTKMGLLDTDFADIKAEMEAVLSKVLSSAGLKAHLNGKSLENVQLVVVPCLEMSSWPLEALDSFAGAKSVTRDFSTHMFHHRLQAQKQIPIKDSCVRFISDPKSEDAGSTEVKKGRDIRPSIDEVVGQLQSKSKWKGLKGKDRIPSQHEWQKSLLGERVDEEQSGCFLFYGVERFLAYAGPETVAGLNITKCGAAFIIDRSANDVSYRRQSKLDNQKDPEMLKIEDSLGTAAILSLSGVNTILQNQWPNSMWANKNLVSNVFGSLRDPKTKTIGEAVHLALQRSARVEERAADMDLKTRVKFNTVIYGLPNTSWHT